MWLYHIKPIHVIIAQQTVLLEWHLDVNLIAAAESRWNVYAFTVRRASDIIHPASARQRWGGEQCYRRRIVPKGFLCIMQMR